MAVSERVPTRRENRREEIRMEENRRSLARAALAEMEDMNFFFFFLGLTWAEVWARASTDSSPRRIRGSVVTRQVSVTIQRILQRWSVG